MDLLAYKLTQLIVENFRSYTSKALDVSGDIIIITGKNGVGKTNLLEAISMLTSGKGLRRAKLVNINRDNQHNWVVSGKVSFDGITHQIGSAINLENRSGKRIVKVNGKLLKSSVELVNYIKAVWITPQMDGIFLDSTSQRRKFFDRIIYNFNSSHASNLNNYESLVRERIKLLKTGQHNDIWLNSLERQISSYGVAIAANRNLVIKHLQSAIDQAKTSFPKADIQVKGNFEQMLKQQTAVEVEEEFKSKLKLMRVADTETGKTNIGTHKTDFYVVNNDKNIAASQCSTGEQKALLISIILAQGRMIAKHNGIMPIMLLDEVVAHLDESRRAELFDEIRQLSGQCFATATDIEIFDDLKDIAEFISL